MSNKISKHFHLQALCGCSDNIYFMQERNFFLFLLQVWAPQGVALLVCCSIKSRQKLLAHDVLYIHLCHACSWCHRRRQPYTKPQNPRPCLHNFLCLTFVFNKLDHKTTEKHLWVYFLMPFLSTGLLMLFYLESPLNPLQVKLQRSHLSEMPFVILFAS